MRRQLSTSPILDLGWDKAPYLLRGFHRPKDNNNRLLRYSISDGTKLPISQDDSHVHETITFNYYGTRFSDRTSSLYPKKNHHPWYNTSSTTTVLGLWRTNPLIYKKYSPTRCQLIDYYGTRPEKRHHLKKSYSSTRWKLRKRHDLYIHTRRSIKKSS